MKRLWRLILPSAGLAVFLLATYQSFRSDHVRFAQHPHCYFYWGAGRLDSDPLNRHPQPRSFTPCPNNDANCVDFFPEYIDMTPGWPEKLLAISALPAFVIDIPIVAALSGVGISQVATFLISIPLLICAWFHLIGRLLDRWLYHAPVQK